jgi:hypothetical protein
MQRAMRSQSSGLSWFRMSFVRMSPDWHVCTAQAMLGLSQVDATEGMTAPIPPQAATTPTRSHSSLWRAVLCVLGALFAVSGFGLGGVLLAATRFGTRSPYPAAVFPAVLLLWAIGGYGGWLVHRGLRGWSARRRSTGMPALTQASNASRNFSCESGGVNREVVEASSARPRPRT